jgi:hypothetical protein
MPRISRFRSLIKTGTMATVGKTSWAIQMPMAASERSPTLLSPETIGMLSTSIDS